MKTYYCTKWVLTQGIIEFKGEVADVSRRDEGVIYITNRAKASSRQIFQRLGMDVFETLDEAKADALRKAEKNVVARNKAYKRALDTLTKFIKGEFKVSR